MKKYVFLGLAVFYLNGYSQITTHLTDNSEIFVEKGAFYYNIGGTQIKDAVFKNKGNVILTGTSASYFKTLRSDGSAVQQNDAQQNIGGRFINVLNEPTAYDLPNTKAEGNIYSYGQLLISGFDQNNITAYIQQEHRNINHGAYQQIGFPFFSKKIESISAELGKTFTPVRWSQNEVLKYNNRKVVFDNLNFSTPQSDPTGYYILGNKNNSLDLSSITRIITGIPYSDSTLKSVILENAGNGINFGNGGNAINEYNERYNSYLQDGFEIQKAPGGTAWQGNYGRNIYQFSNPFLVNLDLRSLFLNNDIYGIRLEQASGTVNYTPGVGGGAGSFRYVTWDEDNNIPVGDIDWLIVRPLSVFSVKLKNNNSKVVDFSSLRTFSFTSKNGVFGKTKSTATVKQLAVIALNAEKKEIGRTYYVVSPNATSGHSIDAKYQIASNSTDVIGTYEEKKDVGSYDEDFTGKYWLYINEANENDFKGKAIPAVAYNSKIKSLKFEIRENSELLDDGLAEFSTGIPFYFKIGDEVTKISQNLTIPLNFSNPFEVQLFYDKPNTTLNPSDAAIPSRTRVVWNTSLKKWMVLFDARWKFADIEVYDMSGRLITSEKRYKTDTNYMIDLYVSQVYIVRVISENGEIVITKIKF